MADSTESMLRTNLARFIIRYVNYHQCYSRHKWSENRQTRLLGDIRSQECVDHTCRRNLVPKNSPAYYGLQSLSSSDDCLYISEGLRRLMDKFYAGRHFFAPRHCGHQRDSQKIVKKIKTGRMDFNATLCELINDPRFQQAVKSVEEVSRVLEVMWCPTKPAESVEQYAIAKHASIHYILSTHAILPSSECFTPDDIQRIMHLPMEWIGSLPRQEDTRCITKFIARFAELFARKPIGSNEVEDPLDKHARHCGQRVFLDIIRYASTGVLPDKTKKKRKYKYLVVEDEPNAVVDERDPCPPLDWDDQLWRKDVKIVTMPPVSDLPKTPVSMSFTRPIKAVVLKQRQNESMTVDRTSIIREMHQVMSMLDDKSRRAPRATTQGKLSRDLKRSSENLCLPPITNTNKTVTPVGRQDQDLYDTIVSKLPHRAYGIRTLKMINQHVISQLEPTRINTNWLKEPKKFQPFSNWTYRWNPDRRIVVESAILSGHLPRKEESGANSLTQLAQQKQDKPADSIYRRWKPSIRMNERLQIVDLQNRMKSLEKQVHRQY